MRNQTRKLDKPLFRGAVLRAAPCLLLLASCTAPQDSGSTPGPDGGVPEGGDLDGGGDSSPTPSSPTFYVSTTGSDTNPGTKAAPFKTIQHASTTVPDGSTVDVAFGTYAECPNVTRSNVTINGNKSVVECFRIEGDGVTLNAFEITSTDENTITKGVGVYVVGSNNVIQNNDIHDNPWGGVLLWANIATPSASQNDLVQDNRIHHVGQIGVEVRGRNNKIVRNDVSAITQHSAGIAKPPSYVDADCFHFHGSGHLFSQNDCHDVTYTQPENVDPHIDCFQTFESPPTQEAASNTVFDRNVCNEPYSNSSAGLAAKFLQDANGTNLMLTNNLVITELTALVQASSNVAFYNNHFIGNATNPNSQGIQIANSTGTVVENNLFYGQSNGIGTIWSSDATSKNGLTAGHNCVYRDAAHPPWRGKDPGDVWGSDPLFVGNGDYHLQAASPCIDMGLVLPSVKTDLDGVMRPQGAGYDMGAYEHP